MRQLSGLDAEFLAMENGAVTGHFGTVTVVAPTGEGTAPRPLDLAAVRAHLADRLHLIPVFRQRVMTVPFGVDQPYWVDDVDFDVARHVTEVVVPAPGGPRELERVVAMLHARHLDRRHPLWAMYLLTGLTGGHVAMYLKIHHAVMDGVGTAGVLDALFDATPTPAAGPPAPPWEPDPEPRAVDLIGRSPLSLTRGSVRSLRLGVDFMARAPLVATAVARRFLPPPPSSYVVPPSFDPAPLPLRCPPTPFNQEISGARSCAFLELPLRDVKTVSRRTGATVNDVVLALCAGSLRRWLEARDALPDEPLIAAVPVSVRPEEDLYAYGNRLSLVRGLLPTDEPDPLARVRQVSAAMAASRRRQQAYLPNELLADAAEYAPPLVAELGWWLSGHVMRHVNAWNVLISNVRGPSGVRYYAGAEVVGHYPVALLVHGQGLNINVFSMGERMWLGLIADPALVPDLRAVGRHLAAELVLALDASAGLP